MKIIFATNNQHKVEEIKAALPNGLHVISLQEAGIDIEIPEPHDTLQANAMEKAQTIYRLTSVDCFSEDTGLEVEALNGEPGVKSARYAGDEKNFQKNIDKLLQALHAKENRKAKFRTVICLLLNNNAHFFEGICSGRISEMQKGRDGFGYDSVFIPDGTQKTFAQMSLSEKNGYSHRRIATDKLVTFLNTSKLKQQYWAD